MRLEMLRGPCTLPLGCIPAGSLARIKTDCCSTEKLPSETSCVERIWGDIDPARRQRAKKKLSAEQHQRTQDAWIAKRNECMFCALHCSVLSVSRLLQ